jgi:hypothetical protein
MKRLVLWLAIASEVAVGTPLARVELVDSGSPLLVSGRSYVGPYKVQLDKREVEVLCIDFADESKVGTNWSAYVSNLGDQLVHTYHPDKLTLYREEAYLYSLIVQPGSDRIGLQGAAWAILDPTYKPNSSATAWIDKAMRNYASIELNRFAILTDSSTKGETRNQEFITMLPVPEPNWLCVLVGMLLTTLSVMGRRRN